MNHTLVPRLIVQPAPWKVYALFLFAALLFCYERVNADGPALRRIYPPGAQQGTTIEVAALGDAPKWPVKIWTDHPGLQFEALKDKGKFRVVVAADVPVGIHHVRFYDDDNSTDPMRFVVGLIAESVEQETNDSAKEATTIKSLPICLSGVLEKRGDVDTFAVELEAGQTLVADVSAQQSLRSPVDISLQVCSEKGTVLAQNLDHLGLDPHVQFTARNKGRYLVRLFGFPETPDSTISFAGADNFVYRLTLTTSGWIEAVLPLAVSTTSATKVQLIGQGLPKLDALEVPPQASGSAWIAHAPGLCNTWSIETVDYPVIVEQARASEEPLQVLEIPQSLTGCLAAAREVDRYKFQAKKGDKLQFTVSSRRFGFPSDVSLRILDSQGKSLQREDDSKKNVDPELKWQVPSDGDYTLEVSDAFGKGGPLWLYRIDATRTSSEAGISVKNDHYQTKVGQALEVPITIDRRAGFDKTIRFSVTGLNATAECPAVESTKDGDSAKEIKLKITCKEKFSGPIKIEGTVEGSTQPLVIASPSDPRVFSLWLTVQ